MHGWVGADVGLYASGRVWEYVWVDGCRRGIVRMLGVGCRCGSVCKWVGGWVGADVTMYACKWAGVKMSVRKCGYGYVSVGVGGCMLGV